MRRPRKEQVHKPEFDIQLAIHHDFPQQDIVDLTAAFLQEIVKHLLEGKEVYLRGFGTFQLVERKGRMLANLTRGNFKKGETVGKTIVDVRRKYYVVFRKAVQLKEQIQERFGKEKVLEEDHGKARRGRIGKRSGEGSG